MDDKKIPDRRSESRKPPLRGVWLHSPWLRKLGVLVVILIIFSGGVIVGGQNPHLADVQWWGEWWTGGKPKPPSAKKPKEKQPPRKAPTELLRAMAQQVRKLQAREDFLQTGIQEAGIALSILEANGEVPESPACLVHSERSQRYREELEQIRLDLEKARGLESSLRAELERDRTNPTLVDPKLQQAIRTYLIRRQLLRDVPNADELTDPKKKD